VLYLELVNDRIEGHLREDIMIKLSYSDGRFVVRVLEQRRAAVQRLPVGVTPADMPVYFLDRIHRPTSRATAPVCKAQSAELRRLDAVLTHVKAELPQITDPEIVETVR
jgi:hypothetical protein